MKNNIYSNKLYMFIAFCIVIAGIAINNVYTVSAPDQVVAEKSFVAGYDDDNSAQDWYPEVKTTKTVTKNVPIIHKVVLGDCVYNLSRKHNTTVKKVTEWNKLRNASLIRVGQELVVGYETKTFEEPLVEEIISLELEQVPDNINLKTASIFKADEVNNNSLYILNNNFRNQEKDDFSIVDYIRSNKLTGEALLTANMFQKSHELDFIQIAEQLGILYNDPERREYDLATIALSTVDKLKYRYGGKMKLIKRGKEARVDCSAFRWRLLQLFGNYDLKYQSTGGLFAKRARFTKDIELEIGQTIGYVAYRDKAGKKIAGHCWVYIGNNLFAHMSSTHGGVAFSTLEHIQRFSQVKTLYIA
ncbi:MAG: LysM peptidoglycan-binding domain-containing protein [bacterium]